MGLSRKDYAQALVSALPVGQAWRRDPAAVLSLLLDALAAELALVDGRGDDLLREFDPGEAVELLDEWERLLGLPDPCAPAPETLSGRQAAASTALGGSSAPTLAGLQAIAATYGALVTIEPLEPARAGSAVAGDPVRGDAWAYAFLVSAPLVGSVLSAVAGSAKAGDPLRTWGDDGLECALEAAKPAHLAAIYAYV